MSDEIDDKITVPIYELTTIGDSVNGWRLKGLSKFVYLDRQDAASSIEDFEKAWYDKKQFEHAKPGTLKTEIRERVLKVSHHVLERILRENERKI